ncbi:MAG: hypothetical protein HUJ54_13130, partial [Erysipelotrichaceae bacterium]|nr:hypothetical protein [Erysipelotrichaceae bacterium]
ASSNDGANIDKTIETAGTLANNPYAVTVDALDADGKKAQYSNYGIGTTDVIAPGQEILSTTVNRQGNLVFNGEVNAHAPQGSEARSHLLSYTSFDQESVNPIDTFAVYTDENGKQWGSDCIYPVNPSASGAFDGTGVLTVKSGPDGFAYIQSGKSNLSGLEEKPRYVSYRVKTQGMSESQSMAIEAKVPVILTKEDGTTLKKFKSLGIFFRQPGMPEIFSVYSGDLASAEILTEEEQAAGFTGSYIDWEEFSIVLGAQCKGSLTEGSAVFCYDSIALGSVAYPFIHYLGTSMAAPEATGVLSVLAGKYSDRLGTAGSPEFAEKLAALVKGSANYSAAYEPYCATSGSVSVDGASNPGPAVTEIFDGISEFTVTGYFMENASVTLNGTDCQAAVKDLGNEKYQLTVQKPSGWQGGTPVITVKGANGKMDRSIVNISNASQEESADLYDHANISLPQDISMWHNYDLTGYNGKIYIYPRTVISNMAQLYPNAMYEYNPETETWNQISIPVESLTVDGIQYMDQLLDATACTYDGKLVMLLTGT